MEVELRHTVNLFLLAWKIALMFLILTVLQSIPNMIWNDKMIKQKYLHIIHVKPWARLPYAFSSIHVWGGKLGPTVHFAPRHQSAFFLAPDRHKLTYFCSFSLKKKENALKVNCHTEARLSEVRVFVGACRKKLKWDKDKTFRGAKQHARTMPRCTLSEAI